MTTNAPTASESEPVLIRDRESPRDWFEHATEKLQAISALEKNWDSYGAVKPSSLSLHYAHTFLNFLHRVVGATKPVITPSPNGNICFEWEDSTKTLTTEIDDSGVHHYYYSYYADGYEEEGDSVDSAKIRELLLKP